MNEQQLPQPYSNFEQPITGIRSDFASAELLGYGEESAVYKLCLNDGVYAVKFARAYLHQR